MQHAQGTADGDWLEIQQELLHSFILLYLKLKPWNACMPFSHLCDMLLRACVHFVSCLQPRRHAHLPICILYIEENRNR
jgi:hypothetical protein